MAFIGVLLFVTITFPLVIFLLMDAGIPLALAMIIYALLLYGLVRFIGFLLLRHPQQAQQHPR